MKFSKLLSLVLSVAVTLLVVVLVVSADNWTAPSTEPPANNAAAPVNIGGSAQSKTGGLIVGASSEINQTSLLIPIGNLVIGTTDALGAAPNGRQGNARVNDLYINSIGKWASELSLSAPATPAPSGSQSFDTAGAYSFVVPAGVTLLNIEAWGAGGGGTGACTIDTVSTSFFPGLGGGGGAYAKKTVSVFPGDTYVVTVGAGGAGSVSAISSCNASSVGGKSSFGSHLTAAGGGRPSGVNTPGGHYYKRYIGHAPGGAANTDIGVTSQAGGPGNNGVDQQSLWGTGYQIWEEYDVNRENIIGGSGGSSPYGGTQKVGILNNGDTGNHPGGGGAGGAYLGLTQEYKNGGSGAAGKVLVTW